MGPWFGISKIGEGRENFAKLNHQLSWSCLPFCVSGGSDLFFLLCSNVPKLRDKNIWQRRTRNECNHLKSKVCPQVLGKSNRLKSASSLSLVVCTILLSLSEESWIVIYCKCCTFLLFTFYLQTAHLVFVERTEEKFLTRDFFSLWTLRRKTHSEWFLSKAYRKKFWRKQRGWWLDLSHNPRK